MNLNETTIENKIADIQTKYYNQNTKSIFFKKNQKMECAARISTSIHLDDLFQKTVYILPNTNKIYFDYLIFKTFGHPTNYDKLVDYILELFTWCIDQNGMFEIHVNLQSFTATAAQRYRDIIQVFCNKCLGSETRFVPYIENLHIYNSPKMIDMFSNIFAGFIDDNIRSKIVIHNQGEHPLQCKTI